MPKQDMLINYVPGEECRIAIVEDGRLEELYQERASTESHVGNIYKGRVVNVEPAIQAAFVDFGLERNGFLHITDLHPMYFPGQAKEDTELVGMKTPRRDRPPIQKCLRRGQELLVQVLKEGIGTKGPTLTSYLSIPGRYLVMMPHMERLGVSRKVEDDEARREMRKILDELKPPTGFGFIIRTAGIGKTKTELKRDLSYLTRLWKSMEQRRKAIRGVGELYTESDLVIRTIRDVFTSDIQRIIVDDETAARRAYDFLSVASPRSSPNVLVYRDGVPLFNRFDLERQIENINARIVPLPSGGSLVIDSTEALVAIDVNSGKMRDNSDAEVTAYKTNVEATDEICRQLRLRDLGGVIVNDLIDMRAAKHRRDIEQRFRNNLKKDRAKTKTLSISMFGILEMTRQRMRPSLKKSIYMDCPFCHGAALVKSPESVVLDVMRRLALVLHRQPVERVELTVSPDVAFLLLNRKREQLVALEQRYGKAVLVRVNAAGSIDFVSLAAFDSRGGVVDTEAAGRLEEPTLEPVQSLSAEAEEELAEESEAAAEQIAGPFADEQREDAQDRVVSTGQSPSAAAPVVAGPDQGQAATDAQEISGGRRGRRGRRGRGGRGGRGGEAPAPAAVMPPHTPALEPAHPHESAPADGQPQLFPVQIPTQAPTDEVPNLAQPQPSGGEPTADLEPEPQPAFVDAGLMEEEPDDNIGNRITSPPTAGPARQAPSGPGGDDQGGRRRRRRRGGRNRNRQDGGAQGGPNRPQGQQPSHHQGQRQQHQQPHPQGQRPQHPQGQRPQGHGQQHQGQRPQQQQGPRHPQGQRPQQPPRPPQAPPQPPRPTPPQPQPSQPPQRQPQPQPQAAPGQAQSLQVSMPQVGGARFKHHRTPGQTPQPQNPAHVSRGYRNVAMPDVKPDTTRNEGSGQS